MIGATITSVLNMGPAAAIGPVIVGVMTASVAYGRWRLAPLEARA